MVTFSTDCNYFIRIYPNFLRLLKTCTSAETKTIVFLLRNVAWTNCKVSDSIQSKKSNCLFKSLQISESAFYAAIDKLEKSHFLFQSAKREYIINPCFILFGKNQNKKMEKHKDIFDLSRIEKKFYKAFTPNFYDMIFENNKTENIVLVTLLQNMNQHKNLIKIAPPKKSKDKFFEALGICEHSYEKAVRKLEKMNFLTRIEKGYAMINPNIIFWGSDERRFSALEAYTKLRYTIAEI